MLADTRHVAHDRGVTEPISIHHHHPSWPLAYERERERLVAALGARLADIAHVGSTAVPGLAAKPIIDVLVGVADMGVADACAPAFVALGYAPVPADDPDRRTFRRGGRHDALDPGYHVHVVPLGSAYWRDRLRFRDLMRANPRMALHYQALKQVLAERCGGDRRAYAAGKAAYIDSVVGTTRP